VGAASCLCGFTHGSLRSCVEAFDRREIPLLLPEIRLCSVYYYYYYYYYCYYCYYYYYYYYY
jgi:hypothetical protein